MSDEPLYCPWCGEEIGPDHGECFGWDAYASSGYARAPEPMPFCELCGARVEACACPEGK